MKKNNLYLYNSITSKKELFVPINDKNITLYVCGPTIYSSPHLGNARSTVVYDLLYRILKNIYPKITYIRNITDIDDKINNAALERKITISELANEILEEFYFNMKEIGNLPPSFEPKATEHIKEIIALIEKLIDNGNAYEKNGNVYFSIKSYQDYGKLSKKKVKDLIAGSRIEVSQNKENPEDFVLWKPAKDTDDQSAKFQSPWGLGRPGWHIECSAMSMKYLGKSFDIHGGGADLKFPHHENEIAQSCSAYPNSQFAKYWVHNGFLTVNGEKMSKSLGNFITVRDLLKSGIEGRVLRLIFLGTHYRKPLDYNLKTLDDTKKLLSKIDELLHNFNKIADTNYLPQPFIKPLLDDLNVAKPLAYVASLVKELHKDNSDKEKLQFLANIVYFLGLENNRNVALDIPDEILSMAKKIKNARQEKDYQKADFLRDKLIYLGYELQYNKDGDIKVKQIIK